jgi:hypothetical protein
MRRQSETLLILPLLPIFFLGMFPALLFGFLGFAGLGLFGILLICVGLADGLQANCDFNREVIIQGYARPTERAVQASNLHAAFRIAVVLEIVGAGLIIAALIGLFA